MYLVRFSYDVLPADRQKAIDLIRKEVESAAGRDLNARLLVPLTRGLGGAALHLEVELKNLDQLEEYRHEGAGTGKKTASWMHEFSEILLAPPGVEILRVDQGAGKKRR
jgi:hypothetical protein